MGAWPCPRHRLGSHDAAVRAPQPPQLALDDATAGAEVQVAPALDAAVMDLELPAGLPAGRADAPAAAQAHGHDHPLRAERDVRHAGAGQAQQALECGGDAHVALPREPLNFDSQQPAPRAAARRPASAQLPQDRFGGPAAQARAERGPSGRHFTPNRRGDPEAQAAT